MAAPGIYGKHPGFGDFISADLPELADRELVPWMTGLLAETRKGLGEDWEPVWDVALPLRFWIGGAIWGGPHLKGVARPSRDRVGRRFPLIAVAETADAPPVQHPDQDFYQVTEAALAGEVTSASALREQLAAHLGDATGAVDVAPAATFWAANPALDVADLLGQIEATDRQRAAAARSYWWTGATEGRASAVLACDGLPRAGELAWLLAGVPAEARVGTETPLQIPPAEPRLMANSEDRNAGRQ
ncbi:type VI secretion system-associated protein TagF [Paracoccus zhejiangensis]|uniref:Type VI secretion system-associated protein TagF n=1 Tax=Paracoccus zhejiangensis TaxID=1077935 RepID=A0A2H5F073_9RHOB|nr:type VI secretion system-associated protein TagF [Paracoccus zhejiangensis]AUH64932.1 type VI secretion system-associated protein TagF [Paracoccus zhejiangensis]